MRPATLAALLFLATSAGTPLLADPARDAILAELAKAAGGEAFSAARGEAFFTATHTGGKPDTPSCASCHGTDPAKGGQTRAGKAIEPMAVSVNPKRFTDPAEVDKWFKRNCSSVLGRECTAAEKGDVLTWLIGK